MNLSIRDQAWSPYVSGGIIGLLQVPAFILIGTALGASSSYVTVGAQLASLADASVAELDYAARHLWGAKNWWQVAMIGGIALGAFISARLSGSIRGAVSPIWSRATGGASRGPRFAMAFGGGFLMLLGARIADGCTSGHGISGLAQMSLGSFVAVTAMFVGGILTASLFLRRI
jgi:uncharacterized protein